MYISIKIRYKVFTILNFLYDQLSWVPQKWGAFMLVPPSDPNGVLVGQQKWASHIVFVLCSSLCIMHLMYVSIYENSGYRVLFHIYGLKIEPKLSDVQLVSTSKLAPITIR